MKRIKYLLLTSNNYPIIYYSFVKLKKDLKRAKPYDFNDIRVLKFKKGNYFEGQLRILKNLEISYKF